MLRVEHKPETPATVASGVVVLAASYGGLHAIRTVLAALPRTYPVPIVVILHRTAVTADPLVRILARTGQLPVHAATDGTSLLPGTITVPPAGHRAGLTADRSLRVWPADGQRLSADTVMLDAARHYGAGAVGVVLTGKLSDGVAGVRAINEAGGTVIVEDPLDCPAPGMPTAALATGCVDHRLPLALIGPTLVALVTDVRHTHRQGPDKS